MDLFEAKAEVPKCEESVKPTELGDLVRPIATVWVHFFGPEQADLVVMAKHPRGYLAEPSELSDVQHDSTIRTPSHNVKVKTQSKECGFAWATLRHPHLWGLEG